MQRFSSQWRVVFLRVSSSTRELRPVERITVFKFRVATLQHGGKLYDAVSARRREGISIRAEYQAKSGARLCYAQCIGRGMQQRTGTVYSMMRDFEHNEA